MIAAVALLLAAAAPGFAPPLDRPYRLVTEERREVAGQPRRFTAERRLVFHRDASGLSVEVTLTDLFTDAPAEVARRFLTGAGGLKGRTLRFRLAADGQLLSVDDEPAIWSAMLAGMRAITPSHPGRHLPVSRDPAGALEALPAAARLALLGSALAGIGCDPALLPPPGTRPVALPISPGPTTDASPAGTETSARDAGLVRLVTRAGSAAVQVTRTRTVDPATGLLASEEETTEIHLGNRVRTTRSSRRLIPVS